MQYQVFFGFFKHGQIEKNLLQCFGGTLRVNLSLCMLVNFVCIFWSVNFIKKLFEECHKPWMRKF